MKSWLQLTRLVICSSWLALSLSLGSTAHGAVAVEGFTLIDLSSFALSPEEPVARQLSALPDGPQTYRGVPFLVSAPMALTGIESARIADVFPHKVVGIKIGRATKRLHLLHATLFAEKDGMPLAKIVFHYANGTQESVRLGYGVHARSWVIPRLEKRAELFDGNSQLAWSEVDARRDSGLRLFQTAIENPKPGEIINSIDIVSLFSHAAPFIAALTVEGPESKLPPSRSLTTRKAVRDLHESPETLYRQELSVRITDESGTALTNAVASLSITDDKESFFLNSDAADARGVVRLPYPPLHAVGVSVWVHAPGRMPVVIAESKTNLSKFTGNYTVVLKRGTTIGGVVKDAQGKPIADAEIVIHKATRISPHHYSRVDYDITTTGADGKWKSDCLPADLSGLGFQISHPEFRPSFYMTDGYAPFPTNATTSSSSSSSTSTSVSYRRLPDGTMEPITTRRVTVGARGSLMPLVTSNALLAANTEMVLQPAILITGTALDSTGKPLTNTPVIFQQNFPSPDRRYLLTDAQGRFRTMAMQQGNGTLSLVLPNQSPVLASVNITADMPPVELKLTPPLVLYGRVQDRNSRPVAGARVRLDEWQNNTDLLQFQTLTDEQGSFIWTGAPPSNFAFYVTKTNYSNSRYSFGGNLSNVVITLTRPAGVYGKVFDAETKKPIETFFVVPGRKYSQGETRINWERSSGLRGFGGEYSLRLSTYYFQPEARVMIEAPGYEPQISRALTGVDSHTNDFALKRGKGLSGVVLLPDGSPAVGASLTIIEKGDSGYMDQSGQVRGSGGSGDVVRSDTQGRFEFMPKLEPDKLFVTHEQGFGEAKVANIAKDGKITLQKWARVKGVMRVGEKGNADASVRLMSNYEAEPDPDGRAAYFSFSLKAEPDADGNFVIEKVPPGEHRLAVEYKFKDDRYGEAALSHGFFVTAKPGETAEATLGGTGRRVVGRINLTGGDHSDVDWKRDVHRLHLSLPGLPGNARAAVPQDEGPLVLLSGLIRGNQPISVEAMRERQRAERSYVLLVETNGTFRADHVPPGKYQLMINVTDPEDEYYNRRSIGAMNMEVTVPDDKAAAVNAPHDIGVLNLTIRPRLRIGKTVSSFEGKGADGKMIKLSDFRGKPVLLHFWGLSLGYNTTEIQMLKELQANYGASGKLVILGCNLDGPGNNPSEFAQRQGFTWKQMYLGQWDQTPVPGMFGLNGSTGCVLIDAEGKLASATMRGTVVRTTVVNALSGGE
jgi:thiol-disulfide isomerase/thioredoxin